jgi:hypothetical protein
VTAWPEPGDRAAPIPSRHETGDADFARATEEIIVRLGRRGVRLSGRETGEQLVDLLDAVERFEMAVQRAGGDLLVDEPLPGALTPIRPDDPAFVLPVRVGSESVADFTERVVEATARVARAHRHQHTHDRE